MGNNYLTHGIHSYHAKYIPSIPKYFIEKYSLKGDYVLDPFCGSGTTLLESMLLERNSVGVDLSFIATKISKAKTSIVDPKLMEETFERFKSDYETIENVDFHEFPNKYVWYTKTNADVLDKILTTINKIENTTIKNIYETAFSSILKRVSNKRKTWNNGYIADNVLPNVEFIGDVYKIFENKIKEYNRNFKKLYKEVLNKEKVKTKVVNTDIMKYNSDKKFDLIVTSPPYPFAVDFVKYNRLTYYWFNQDVNLYAEKETGSRHKRSRKKAVEEFFSEMKKLYLHIFDYAKVGAHFCMTVGNTRRNNKNINFYEWLVNLFTNNNWELVDSTKRTLESQSMAQKRIKEEHVVVFKKIR